VYLILTATGDAGRQKRRRALSAIVTRAGSSVAPLRWRADVASTPWEPVQGTVHTTAIGIYCPQRESLRRLDAIQREIRFAKRRHGITVSVTLVRNVLRASPIMEKSAPTGRVLMPSGAGERQPQRPTLNGVILRKMIATEQDNHARRNRVLRLASPEIRPHIERLPDPAILRIEKSVEKLKTDPSR